MRHELIKDRIDRIAVPQQVGEVPKHHARALCIGIQHIRSLPADHCLDLRFPGPERTGTQLCNCLCEFRIAGIGVEVDEFEHQQRALALLAGKDQVIAEIAQRVLLQQPDKQPLLRCTEMEL